MHQLKSDLERLFIWWIPVFVATVFANLLAASYLSNLLESESPSSSLEFVNYLSWINLIFEFTFQHLENVVVAAWLWWVASRPDFGRPLIWSAFGLLAGLFAVVTYIGVLIYAEREVERNT